MKAAVSGRAAAMLALMRRGQAERLLAGRRRLVALVCLGLSSGMACEQVLGVDFDSAERRPRVDAGGDVTASCGLFVAPGPPQTTGAADNIDFVVVISSLDFGDRVDDQGNPVFPNIGYDVDGTCTGPSAAPCNPASWTGLEHLDGPGGQDNGVGRILLVQKDIVGDQVVSSSLLNAGVASGSFAPFGVLRVTGYGGFTEDEHVVVDWFVPVPPKPDALTGFVPRFDGSDELPVAAMYEASAGEAGANGADAGALRVSRHRDEDAYVVRRTLVAKFPNLIAPMANGYFAVEEAVVTGMPVRDPLTGRWSLQNGIFSGRARMKTLLEIVPEMAFVTSGVELCPDDPNFGFVKRMICAGADTLFAGRPGPDVECDGVSVGLAFETTPALLGPAVDLAVRPPLCIVSSDVSVCSTPPPEADQ